MYGKSSVERLSPDGWRSSFIKASATVYGVATNNAAGHIWAAFGTTVNKYDMTGTLLVTVTLPDYVRALVGPDANGNVYVPSGNGGDTIISQISPAGARVLVFPVGGGHCRELSAS